MARMMGDEDVEEELVDLPEDEGQSDADGIVVHRHWLSIFDPPLWVIAGIAAVAIAFAIGHPQVLRGVGQPLYGVLRGYLVHFGVTTVNTLGVLSFLGGLGAIGSWAMSTVGIDETNVIYRQGPFSEVRVPRYSVQEVGIERPMLGMIFGYGTLTVMSGREVEHLTYIPDIDEIAGSIVPEGRRSRVLTQRSG